MNLRPSGYEPDELPTAPLRDIIESYMVPKTGIEPVREYKSRRILSPVRLPVPPLRHTLPSYVLLSQAVAHQVPSALKSLTSVFGMGTGVSSSL